MSEAIRYRLPMTSRAAEMSLNLKRGITNRGRWVADPLGKEVHWVAPRAVPVSWCGHIWSHMVTFSVTGCMVDDHSSSLLSGGFTHFDLAFIVRLRGRSCHHGTSTNESVATFATTEVWLESSTVVSTKLCKILQAMSVGVLAVLSAVATYEVP